MTTSSCKQPLWKRFLSYFRDLPIDKASSLHNPHLYVSLSKGRYQLCTNNAVYSFGDLYDNFMRTFDKIDLDGLDIKKVLILGFGLGSIPFMLEKTFNKHYTYTAVEIDTEVLNLANKYVLPELNSEIEIINTDAFDFINAKPQNEYDLITMDIFLDDIVPPRFEQTLFLKQLQDLLSPDGILLYNRLSLHNKDKELTRKFYQQKFLPTFPDATYFDLESNWMLMNRAV